MADPLAPAGTTESGQETTTIEDTGSDVGTTVTEATPDSGQASAPAQTAEDSFFDSTTLAPELLPAYKQMQAAFTQKTQAIAGDRNKIAEYDRFMNDEAYRNQLLKQYGYGQQPTELKTSEDWQPDTWEDVMKKAEDRALDRFRGEVQPLLREVQGVKKTQIEKDLDEHVPEWRQYEDEMTETLTAHPTLASDPVKLARLALPEQVLQSKAMQAALTKLQQKNKGASVTKGSTTAAQPSADIPRQKRTFQQAVDVAKQHIASALKAS